MKYSIEEIRKTQKGEGFWLRLSNEMATQLIYRIQTFDISPNLFTLFSLIFGFVSGVALAGGHLIIAAITLNVMYLFDNLDGQWARIKKMSSTFGALFDSLVDGWNLSIIVFSMGIYLYNTTHNVAFLYLTILFFMLSYLEFGLEKNILHESLKEGKSIEKISLQENHHTLKPMIKIVGACTLYDKWIFVITLGMLFGYVQIALIYVVAVRCIHYSVDLLKLYLKFK